MWATAEGASILGKSEVRALQQCDKAGRKRTHARPVFCCSVEAEGNLHGSGVEGARKGRLTAGRAISRQVLPASREQVQCAIAVVFPGPRFSQYFFAF